MKNIFLLILLIAFHSTSWGATRFQFFPGGVNAMMVVTPQAPDGVEDEDSVQLYRFMNVPVQDGMLGKGKSIVSAERDFNLVCGEYRKQCQVILKKSPKAIFNPGSKSMRFELSGEEADLITMLFQMTGDRQMEFWSSDRKFHFFGQPGKFIFEASESLSE